MLKFIEDKDHFKIEETILHGAGNSSKEIYYTKDIRWKRVNKDPWQKTTMADREWFNKYYRPKFEENKNG